MPDDTRAIEPALTPEEWKREEIVIGNEITADIYSDRQQHFPRQLSIHVPIYGSSNRAGYPVSRLTQLMALANAALPDGDPRKITYRDIDLLRETANSLESGGPNLWALANKLESLLPPDVTTYTLREPET